MTKVRDETIAGLLALLPLALCFSVTLLAVRAVSRAESAAKSCASTVKNNEPK